MGNAGYSFSDYFKDITTTDIAIVNDAAADKEDANYPIENSQDEQVALCTRTDDKTNIKIQFDINSASGGTKELKFFAILNHNFSGGSIKIYSYTADDYSTGQNLEETVTVRAKDMFVRISSPTDARYWEIDISHNGSATSGDSYYEWGRVMCYDDLTQLQQADQYDRERGYGFRNIVNVTPHGIKWVHKLADNQERIRLTYHVAKNTYIPSEPKTLYDAVDGDAHPFAFIPDIALTNIYYGYLVNPELHWVENIGEAADGSTLIKQLVIEFIEAVRGKA